MAYAKFENEAKEAGGRDMGTNQELFGEKSCKETFEMISKDGIALELKATYLNCSPTGILSRKMSGSQLKK